jgi:hypothetical protein
MYKPPPNANSLTEGESHPFAGIAEKLKRANENIVNLDSEIAMFFAGSKYPVIPQENRQATLKAIQYHKELAIPLRFNVLSGEIIHHLRSCFDHLIWELSSSTYRTRHRVEFPVLERRPSDKDTRASYKRKIKGIGSSDVKKLIGDLQPYNSPDPRDSLLFVLHNMDITDKHKELLLCHSKGMAHVPYDILREWKARNLIPSDQGGKMDDLTPELVREFEQHAKVVPQIAFVNFGRMTSEPIIPALMELYNFVNKKVMPMFALKAGL